CRDQRLVATRRLLRRCGGLLGHGGMGEGGHGEGGGAEDGRHSGSLLHGNTSGSPVDVVKGVDQLPGCPTGPFVVSSARGAAAVPATAPRSCTVSDVEIALGFLARVLGVLAVERDVVDLLVLVVGLVRHAGHRLDLAGGAGSATG